MTTRRVEDVLDEAKTALRESLAREPVTTDALNEKVESLASAVGSLLVVVEAMLRAR